LKTVIKKAIAFISSPRLSVACLLYCAIIVVCGTLYQVDHGLLASQDRFFHSWIFYLAGFLPLPGLQSVLSLVLINLLVVSSKIISFRFSKLGLLFIHAGVIILIAGAGISSHFVRESFITIGKKQTVVEAVDLNRWELSISLNGVEDDALWSSSSHAKFSELKRGSDLTFPNTKNRIHIRNIYRNCQARGRKPGAVDTLLHIPSESGTAIPGLVLEYKSNTQLKQDSAPIFVYGGLGEALNYYRQSDTITISLLPERVPLPVKIGLVDFILEKHLGTSNAKKVQSRIHVSGENIDREVVISMNRPFKYRSHTFYQTGYSEDDGPRTSTITVVENPVRFLPHVASAIIMFGLLFHFGYRFVCALKASRIKRKGLEG
jgi:hypothetical protein